MSLLLQNPWGLLALSSLLAVGAIYLFYRQRRSVRVSALFLWEGADREKAGGRTLRPPANSRSLWLDLLAALSLSLAVAGVALLRESGAGVVVILDNSLSMQSCDAWQRARAEVEALSASGHPPMILLAGLTPEVLLPEGADLSDLPGALAGYAPFAAGTALEEAVTLARSRLTGEIEIHLFTDHEVTLTAPVESRIHLHVLAGRGINPAILQALRVRESGAETLLITVGGTGSPTPLRVTAAGMTLITEMIPPLGEKRQRLTLTLPAEIGEVTVSLDAPLDTLAADSRVTLLAAPDTRPEFSVSLADQEVSRKIALALDAAGARPGRAELLVTSDSGAQGSLLTLRLPAAEGESADGLTGAEVPSEALTFAGPYIIDTAHPLGRDLDLTGVYWSTGGRKIEESAFSFILAGNRPLFALLPDGSLSLDLLPARSNLPRTPAWPVLFANLVELCTARVPGLHRSNYLPNEPLERVVAAESLPVESRLFWADAEGRRAPASAVPLTAPRRPGVYTLYREGKDGEGAEAKIAVNALAPEESRTGELAAEDSARILIPLQGENGRSSPESLTWVLVLAGAACLLLNLGLNRRGGTA